MTKEKLENEAAAYAKKHRTLSYCGPADTYVSDEKEIIKAILHFAEPREKRITELEEKIEQMKNCIISCCAGCERLSKLYKELES